MAQRRDATFAFGAKLEGRGWDGQHERLRARIASGRLTDTRATAANGKFGQEVIVVAVVEGTRATEHTLSPAQGPTRHVATATAAPAATPATVRWASRIAGRDATHECDGRVVQGETETLARVQDERSQLGTRWRTRRCSPRRWRHCGWAANTNTVDDVKHRLMKVHAYSVKI